MVFGKKVVENRCHQVALHLLVADAASGTQQRLLVEGHKAVDVLPPVREQQVFTLLGAKFGEIQEHANQTVKLIELLGIQVVLGHHNISLAHPVALEAEQIHIRCTSIGAAYDQLGCGEASNGEEQLVLHFGKQAGGVLLIGPVIFGQGEEVTYLLVEALLRARMSRMRLSSSSK